MRVRVLLAVMVAAVLAGAALSTVSRAERETLSIRIVSARAMDVPGPLHELYSRVYEVRVAITGWRMYLLYETENRPDGGHWRLYVDDEYASTSNDGVAHTAPLPPGPHRIYAELVNNDDTPLYKRAAYSDEVIVRAP